MVVVKAIEAFFILAALGRDAIADPASTNCEVIVILHFFALFVFNLFKVALKYTWCMWTQGLEYTYTMWMERLEYTLPRLFCSWQESNVDGSA